VQLNLQKFKETQAWHKIQAADRDADRALRSAQAEVRQNNRSTMTEAQKQGLVFKYRNAANLRRAQIGAKISNGIGGVVPKYDDTTIAQLTAEANALDAQADKFEGVETSPKPTAKRMPSGFDWDKEVKGALSKGADSKSIVKRMIEYGWSKRGAEAKVKWLSGGR
jgi:hypothetical protein